MRFGLHHRFAPNADMIGSFLFENADSEADLTERSTGFDVISEDVIKGDTYLTELQYLFGNKPVKLLAGGGHLKSDLDRETSILLVLDEPMAPPLTTVDYSPETDIQHTNLYLYTHIYYPKMIRWTVGASADFFQEDEGEDSLRDRNQVNPKMGLTWHPFRGTVLRAAAFRVHRRSLTLTKQTLEPTQVAGFNQFYDDVPGTDTWQYGVAADQKISANLFAGIEYAKRNLDVLVRVFTPPDSVDTEQVDREEHIGRAYLYWAPYEWVTLKSEYLYERLERGSEFNNGVETVETHRFPLGANFFLPKGWLVKTQATYFSQHGRFNRLREFSLPAESGRDQFWIIDAAIGYRLPRRFGTISLEAKNLFDTAFNYYDSDLVNPIIQPERLVMLKVNLSL
jgi:outer membrane receptor protein involved in Fe transport